MPRKAKPISLKAAQRKKQSTEGLITNGWDGLDRAWRIFVEKTLPYLLDQSQEEKAA
jgi:hypothetical protein